MSIKSGEAWERGRGLCLSRRPGETILIGPDITITIVEIRGGSSVGVRITAPDDVLILRAELKQHDKEFPTDND